MKILGFIGGTSWHDTGKYYLLINEGFSKANGGQIILYEVS
ncbi:MAG: aspartate/glutamate racemase [Cryomorphaceae bacterium]|jgi:aspartate/glutamate racemase